MTSVMQNPELNRNVPALRQRHEKKHIIVIGSRRAMNKTDQRYHYGMLAVMIGQVVRRFDGLSSRMHLWQLWWEVDGVECGS